MSVVLRCSVRLVRLVSPGTFARRSGCGLAVTARVLCGRLHADPCRASQVWRLGRVGGAIAMVGQQHPPAGWYPDPAGGGGRRYWDGGQWMAVAPPPSTGTNGFAIAALFFGIIGLFPLARIFGFIALMVFQARCDGEGWLGCG